VQAHFMILKDSLQLKIKKRFLLALVKIENGGAIQDDRHFETLNK
jgi:hypothetical protein